MFKSAFGAMVIAFIVSVIIAAIVAGIWEGCRDFFSKPYVSIPIVLVLIVSIIIHLVRAT
ncbi:hypothetical protein C2R96_00035 [Helicobacter pylori]|uniref:hypothetical protein n=1 Tax=Helicobacter pylori TaxID=210 RepID=UPI000D3B53D3|nr:hypothetical protein [Helicobacter pylori]PUD34034.1 hypothetical protein C2R96_00035 [Helicobacter pylori]WQX15342.1 hypothetical protein E5P70_01110 [Helicobacter pylori]